MKNEIYLRLTWHWGMIWGMVKIAVFFSDPGKIPSVSHTCEVNVEEHTMDTWFVQAFVPGQPRPTPQLHHRGSHEDRRPM